MDETYFTPEEVAKLLNIKVTSIHRLVRNEKLRCIQIDSKTRRFPKEYVEEFVQRQSVGGPKPIDTSGCRDVRFPRKGGVKSTSHGADDFTSIAKEVNTWHYDGEEGRGISALGHSKVVKK